MDKPWEHDNLHDLLIRLIGFSAGQTPEQHIASIRAWRANIIRYLDDCFLRLKGDEAVLEIGPGCGFTSRALASRAGQLTCLELSVSFLAFARRECAGIPNIAFRQGSYIDLAGIPAHSIDVIVSSAVFIHADIFALNLFFAEAARVLKPRGRVVFDFLDADRLSPSDALFERQTKEYALAPAGYPELCKWNSGTAIMKLARRHGLNPSLFPHHGPSMHEGASHTIFHATMDGASQIWTRIVIASGVRRFFRRHGVGFIQPPAVVPDESRD